MHYDELGLLGVSAGDRQLHGVTFASPSEFAAGYYPDRSAGPK
jgi:hypothetical protein